MTSAHQRLDEINDKLPRYQAQWRTRVASPYVRAYGDAFENYNREKDAQDKRNRAMAELFILSASILTGSILMAAFATTSVRVLAGRGLLNMVCNNNLNVTFNLMHAASSSRTFMFALGGVLDEAKKLANDEVKKAAEALTSTTPMAINSTPLNYATRIHDFIDDSFSCTQAFVQAVRDDRSMGETQKSRIADQVVGIPFCNPPAGRTIDEQKLSQKMELLFYMAAVLDSDQLVRYAPSIGGGTMAGTGQEMIYGKTPITQLPSATDYPKATSPRLVRGRGGYPSYEAGQRVEYKNIGGGIRDRINTLSMQTGNGRFYQEQNLIESWVSDPTDHTSIVKAEQIVNKLSSETRPRQLTDVRMI